MGNIVAVKGAKSLVKCACGRERWYWTCDNRKYCYRPCSDKALNKKRTKSCPTCGSEFSFPPSSRRKYCSVECAAKGAEKKVALNCRHCNKTFYLAPDKAKKQRYCSAECRTRKIKKRLRVACEICCQELFVYPSSKKQRFCSYRCRNHWLITLSKKRGCRNTSIEIAIRQLLEAGYMSYEEQLLVPGVGVVDFLVLNRVIVECDGIYWHNLPGRKKKDAIRDQNAFDRGYKVLRLCETEIKKDPMRCIQKIMKKIFGEKIEGSYFKSKYRDEIDIREEYIAHMARMVCILDGKDHRDYNFSVNIRENN